MAQCMVVYLADHEARLREGYHEIMEIETVDLELACHYIKVMRWPSSGV